MSENVVFFQNNKGYKFAADSLLLFDYIKNIETDTFIELGCGDGIISILYALKYKKSKVFSLDINSAFLENLKKTILENKISNIEIIHSDFVEYSIMCNKKFDLAVFNPPYYHPNEGKINPEVSALISKHQIFFPQYELAYSPARLTNKRFTMIYPSFKITDNFTSAFKTVGFKSVDIIKTSNPRFKIIDAVK